MNTEQMSIPTKPITMRRLALITVVATVMLGALPGSAYCGEYLDKWLAGGGQLPLGYGPEYFHAGVGRFGGLTPPFAVWKFPSGEFLVRSFGGVPNHQLDTWYDQYGKIEYQRDCCFCDPRDSTLFSCTPTTYDDYGNSTTVVTHTEQADQPRSKEVIIKDVGGQVTSDITYTYDHLGNLKTVTSKDKCGNLISQITCTYTYDDRGVVSRSCKDEHGVDKHPDVPSAVAAAAGVLNVPDGNLPDGSGQGRTGQIGSQGRIGIGNTQAVAPGSASAIGGTAGVVGTNAAVVRHPGQSIKKLKRAQGGAAGPATGGTAGAAGPGTATSSADSGVATGGTAGVAGTSATPSGGGNSTSGGTAGVAATPTDASQREPKKSPTPVVTATPAARHLRKRLTVPITAGSATPTPTPSSHGGGGHGGTAGVAGSAAVTGSGGSGSTQRKSQSKKSLNAPSPGGAPAAANVQGSGQSGGNVHPTPTPQ